MKTTKAKKTPAKRGRPTKSKVVIDERPCSVASLVAQQKEPSEEYLVLRVCNNPTWVVVRMDGVAVPVKCPVRVSNKLVGKRIKVCLVSGEPEDYYEYAP